MRSRFRTKRGPVKLVGARILMVTGCLMTVLLLAGCQKKEEVVVNTTEAVVDMIGESVEDTTSYDLRNIELQDNDSGVKNPQSGFKDRFSDNNTGEGSDVDFSFEEPAMDYFNDEESEIYKRWASGDVTEELIKEMYEKGFTGMDKDEDGLSDYEEITEYHSDPNKFSTSGDIYSDGYKVENDMDISKYYDPMWKDVDENMSILPESEYAALLSVYWVEENFHDVEGLTLLDVGMEFTGDLKYAYVGDMEDLVVEVYNTWDKTYAPIEYEIEDGRVKFHVTEGYDKYFLHSKDVTIDFAEKVVE